MSKFCEIIQNECLESASATHLSKIAPAKDTNKLMHCFYSCFKESFIKWVQILYQKKYPTTIDFIADIAFTDGVLKLQEAAEQKRIYESNVTVKTVLYSFCKYKLFEHFQTENRRNKKEAKLQATANRNEAEQAFDDNNEIQLLLLEQTLKKMNHTEKQIIEWRHLEQKSNKEIAEKLGITVESATNKIYRCMENLRMLLKSKI